MGYLLDTNIGIDVADLVEPTLTRFAKLEPADLAMAAPTAAELEASIVIDAALRERRERTTRPLLDAIPILPFDAATARRYGEIVAHCGYNRRKAIDRMIAATALVHGLKLVTRNPQDFREIEGLEVENWS